jgi:hypothetical protein
MREPGKLLKIANISDRERGQLSDILDNLSDSNTFRVLENFLGDKFLPFLDIFQGDTIVIPTVNKVLLRAEYIKIYNESSFYSIDHLAKKYKKNPSVVVEIIKAVHLELKQQNGDINEEVEKVYGDTILVNTPQEKTHKGRGRKSKKAIENNEIIKNDAEDSTLFLKDGGK